MGISSDQDEITLSIYKIIEILAKKKGVYTDDLYHESFLFIFDQYIRNFDKTRSSLNTFVTNCFNYFLKIWQSDNDDFSSLKLKQKKADYKKDRNRIEKAKETLLQKGLSPTIENLKRKTGFGRKRIENSLNQPRLVSMDTMENDCIPGGEENVIYFFNLSNEVDNLPPYKRQVIQAYFFNGNSTYEISKLTNTKESQVRRAKYSALQTLSQLL